VTGAVANLGELSGASEEKKTKGYGLSPLQLNLSYVKSKNYASYIGLRVKVYEDNHSVFLRLWLRDYHGWRCLSLLRSRTPDIVCQISLCAFAHALVLPRDCVFLA